jgi:hypothetical protein
MPQVEGSKVTNSQLKKIKDMFCPMEKSGFIQLEKVRRMSQQ